MTKVFAKVFANPRNQEYFTMTSGGPQPPPGAEGVMVRHILSLSPKPRPRVMFLGTAQVSRAMIAGIWVAFFQDCQQ